MSSCWHYNRCPVMEETTNVANLCIARLPQRLMLGFCSMALCENTFNRSITNVSCTSWSLRKAVMSFCWHCRWCKVMEEAASFLIINSGLMITLISNLGLLLLMRITGNTRTGNKQRRRLGSGYWTRRRVYWWRKEISRTAYIAEAIQGSMRRRLYRQ